MKITSSGEEKVSERNSPRKEENNSDLSIEQHNEVDKLLSRLLQFKPEQIFLFGRKIGLAARERPDITHEVLIGEKEGMNECNIPDEISSTLWNLWRHGNYKVGIEKLKIPFRVHSKSESGSGKV
jgi:hypothetical protein